LTSHLGFWKRRPAKNGGQETTTPQPASVKTGITRAGTETTKAGITRRGAKGRAVSKNAPGRLNREYAMYQGIKVHGMNKGTKTHAMNQGIKAHGMNREYGMSQESIIRNTKESGKTVHEKSE